MIVSTEDLKKIAKERKVNKIKDVTDVWRNEKARSNQIITDKSSDITIEDR